MEFFLTLVVLALVAAGLSGAIAFLLWRWKKPFAKPLAVVLGFLLFLFFWWIEIVVLIAESGRRGHPF